jgi:hypothetical protein
MSLVVVFPGSVLVSGDAGPSKGVVLIDGVLELVVLESVLLCNGDANATGGVELVLELVDWGSGLELVVLTVAEGVTVSVATRTKFGSLEWTVTDSWSDVEEEESADGTEDEVVGTGEVEELLSGVRTMAVEFELL